MGDDKHICYFVLLANYLNMLKYFIFESYIPGGVLIVRAALVAPFKSWKLLVCKLKPNKRK